MTVEQSATEQSYQNTASSDPQDEEPSTSLISPSSSDRTLSGSQIPNFPVTNVEEIQEVLIDFVAGKCCYGKNPAKDIVICDFRNFNAAHYTLQSYGEKRVTFWDHTPYGGEKLDCGDAPDPWSMKVGLIKPFKNFKTKIRVPHTDRVETCTGCNGSGKNQCRNCHGTGKLWCRSCSGTGRVRPTYQNSNENCIYCHGGYSSCNGCCGSGDNRCNVCCGLREVKYFMKMTIDWTNHFDDFTSDTANLPGELITRAKGVVAFEEQKPKVSPITNFPDNSVNTASQKIVTKHSISFLDEKIVLQRHRVRIVPVSEVQYTWNDSQGLFYVYGYENKIYFPDYPQKCCCGCGCTIL